MKRKTAFYSIAGLGIALVLFALILFTPFLNFSANNDELIKQDAGPILALYNKPAQISDEEVEKMAHYTVKWTSPETSEPKFLPALPDSGNILVTIELWDEVAQNASYRQILKQLVEGEYDEKIRHFSAFLAERQQKAFLRLNPEMEVPVNHFPWQNQSPGLYIEAFRHFANQCRSAAPNIKTVWGPAGYPGALEYWPGSDVVDFVSVTLGSQSELLSSAYPQESSIPQMIRRKLHRLRFVDKPVFLLGSEKVDHQVYKDAWLTKVSRDIQPYRVPESFANKERIRRGDLPIQASATIAVENTARNSQPLIGLYDPELRLTDHQAVTAEHIFTDLVEVRNGRFREKFNGVTDRNHDVIVTMEPWSGPDNERDPEVLKKTINGQYDAEFKELYKIIGGTSRNVYLRWAHEMEIPIKRYDWQSQDPILYIQSFRYFASFCKPCPPTIHMVWGPAGDRGSLEWWPGEDVVDYISLAIYGLPDKNITDHTQQENFNTIFKRKFYRMRFVDKPILITEFGVKGPDNFQKDWLENAAETVNQYPEVVGICYFNKADLPEAWGDIEAPNWSISEESFGHFLRFFTHAQ